MQRLIFGAFLIIAATACSAIQKSPDVSFHSKATSRRCTRSLDLTATGFAQRGVHGSFHEFPPADSFADTRIEIGWVVANGSLYAHVKNRSNGSMMIEGRSVLPDQRQRAIAAGTI